jgi:MerR family transcriptional regulator, thiopeptide resistance regulator
LSKLYHVHEFAQLAGVTVKALHHYDRLGLLRPRRSQTGYRLYAAGDLERLEQIIALKFLGLSLREIRGVLNRSDLELRNALRLQIKALKERQALLSRAIHAIRSAELAIEPGKSAAPALLRRIIEVIDMQDSLEGMKKYFSEEAWAKQKARYEQGPSPEWKALYREASELLAEDPASGRALALARRWLERLEGDTAGDPAILIGKTLAWEDREHWPAVLKREITEYNLEEVYKFIGKAVLAHRKQFAAAEFWIRRDPRARASVAWYQMFVEVRIALEAGPAFESTQDVQAQWIDFMHRSTRVDPEVQARSVQAWEDAQQRHQSMWSKLAHDAVGSIGHEPGSHVCQELASRWMDLWGCYLQGDLGVQTSLHRVWAAADIFNRQEVRDLIGAALAWPLRSYFGEAVWARLEEDTRRRPLASLQESARAQIALYRDAEVMMREDRAGPRVVALAERWATLVGQDAGGDREIEDGIRNAWRHQSSWPARLREHVASLFFMDPQTYESVSTFLDEASGIHRY